MILVVPMFDGRGNTQFGGFNFTDQAFARLTTDPPGWPLFGDGHTELPKDALVLVVHSTGSYVKAADANAIVGSFQYNVKQVVLLALGKHIEEDEKVNPKLNKKVLSQFV